MITSHSGLKKHPAAFATAQACSRLPCSIMTSGSATPGSAQGSRDPARSPRRSRRSCAGESASRNPASARACSAAVSSGRSSGRELTGTSPLDFPELLVGGGHLELRDDDVSLDLDLPEVSLEA